MIEIDDEKRGMCLLEERSVGLCRREISLYNSVVIVKVGEIFKEDGLKVIGFNEYFDTIVGERMVSESSLNGIYLTQIVSDASVLDRLIEKDEGLRDKVVGINNTRSRGKRKKYKLGTIFKNGDYLLTAFSRFDEDNRAYLYMNDYINLLLNLWNEIDKVYAGRSVTIPLMGSGITRFKEYSHITEQELLELLLWSFKISRIKFTYPAKVTFVVHDSKKDKVNFYKLRGGYLNGISRRNLCCI
ncbi:macro domain-containing protein [Paenibacillus sp. NPDC056579]|uniref:macro domain-containing protein n=1 Tax=Paenibacillus sp. NPDC056579 TaxID=3345871 RepID=UPI0036AB10D4